MPELSPTLVFNQISTGALAHKILDLRPDPAPRLRLLRDVLRCPPEDGDVRQAEQEVAQSKWVTELAQHQQPDGTWGRFHSQDSQVKTPFPTTEYAIRRALALGLDRHSPILQKAAAFIADHLDGNSTWSDPPEKHDDPRVFPYNIRSISAGMLALIDREHALLEPLWQHWAKLLAAAFAEGDYNPRTELACQQELSGISSKRLMPFHVYYPLLILSATRNMLPLDLEDQMLAYLLHKPDGIYYIGDLRLDTLPRLDDPKFFDWLYGHEVISRFERWKAFAPHFMNWLWSQRGANGLWRMGPGVAHSYAFPMSESWRNPENRDIDCSVRILCLFQRYFES